METRGNISENTLLCALRVSSATTLVFVANACSKNETRLSSLLIRPFRFANKVEKGREELIPHTHTKKKETSTHIRRASTQEQEMLRFVARRNAASAAPAMSRSFVQLQSEKYVERIGDKVVRSPVASEFYPHPKYVQARDKMLYTIWRDNGIFYHSLWVLGPFLTAAWYFKY